MRMPELTISARVMGVELKSHMMMSGYSPEAIIRLNWSDSLPTAGMMNSMFTPRISSAFWKPLMLPQSPAAPLVASFIYTLMVLVPSASG